MPRSHAFINLTSCFHSLKYKSREKGRNAPEVSEFNVFKMVGMFSFKIWFRFEIIFSEKSYLKDLIADQGSFNYLYNCKLR